jgi:hypothetical protein
MDHVLGHLVRRGMNAHAQYQTSKSDENYEFNIPAWGVVVLFISGLSFVLALSAIEYTYGRLVATLTMVESPTGIIFESVSNEDPDSPLDDKKAMKAVEELVLVKEPMITSSFRRTIVHLRAHAGYLSRFRGLSVYIVHSLAVAYLTALFGARWWTLPVIPHGVAAILASVLLARLHMAWTHIVISEASPKPWFKRLADRKAWKKVAGPTAMLTILEQLTIIVPQSFVRELSDPKIWSELNSSAARLLALKLIVVLAVQLFLVVVLVIPATVALTRVQASLLSEAEETVVPFDRSFGGKVIPASSGGSGVISYREAWSTFDWNSRIRLLKVYLKAAAMQFALCIWIFICVTAQLYVILGKDFQKMVDIARYSQQIDVVESN